MLHLIQKLNTLCAPPLKLQAIHYTNIHQYTLIINLCLYRVNFVYKIDHKKYNFLDCDWFKKLLFSTNSLAKLLSDSLLLDSLLLDSLLLDS